MLMATTLLSMGLMLTAAAADFAAPAPLLTMEELKAYRKEHLHTLATVNAQGEREWAKTDPLPPLPERSDRVLYTDRFTSLKNWHHEGTGRLTLEPGGILQLNCIGSQQGAAGCMAFCRTDFPDDICIEYEFQALTTRGLLITFIAAAGRRGEDMIRELPPRSGVFPDYIYSEYLRCYHLSVSRYDDDGVHTGTSNWRRNPGFFLMAGQEDLCKKPRTWYRMAIYKKGPLLLLTVDGKPAGGFLDPQTIPEEIPRAGKIGFRAIGRDVVIQIRNLKVTALQ